MRLVLDASAILAIVFREDGYPILASKVETAEECQLSPVNFWETLTVARKYQGLAGEREVRSWLLANEVRIVEVSPLQSEIAVEARLNYGGRPARLNLGDCFAYALAKERGLPLLFKGKDFAGTDVAPA